MSSLHSLQRCRLQPLCCCRPQSLFRCRLHLFCQKLCVAALGLLAVAAIPASAAANDTISPPNEITQLERQASAADPREQVFLYSKVIHAMTQEAGQEIADGETEQAAATLREVNRYIHLIHLGLAHNAKRLKDAQELMHNTTYRLAEVVHMVSGDDRMTVQETLKQLDQVNEELLAQVFTH